METCVGRGVCWGEELLSSKTEQVCRMQEAGCSSWDQEELSWSSLWLCIVILWFYQCAIFSFHLCWSCRGQFCPCVPGMTAVFSNLDFKLSTDDVGLHQGRLCRPVFNDHGPTLVTSVLHLLLSTSDGSSFVHSWFASFRMKESAADVCVRSGCCLHTTRASWWRLSWAWRWNIQFNSWSALSAFAPPVIPACRAHVESAVVLWSEPLDHTKPRENVWQPEKGLSGPEGGSWLQVVTPAFRPKWSKRAPGGLG